MSTVKVHLRTAAAAIAESSRFVLRAHRITLAPEVIREIGRNAAQTLVGIDLEADQPRPEFTCPVCGYQSYHPRDAEHGYCAHCRAFTACGTGEMQTFEAKIMLAEVTEMLGRLAGLDKRSRVDADRIYLTLERAIMQQISARLALGEP